MTISYNWLSEYLHEKLEPEKLSKILTSIGLEVESMELYEAVKGGLKGLIIGEVLECVKHADADKLSVTKVNIGTSEILQIVCGATNVAAGQKVVVATIGTTIYPTTGEPVTMKKAKIRGVESHGMICAEDEIGIGESHAGILVLPNDAIIGTSAADYFKTYSDIIFEIGLTPNRMDAMCHLGVAKDVCAYLSHHIKKETIIKSPYTNSFKADNQSKTINVTIENTEACKRYSGVSIAGVTIAASPDWLQNKLKAIGLRPINNIVDITNFILHETGQPLHAFDADKIEGQNVIIKNLSQGTTFVTLDDKERKLHTDDLIICNAIEPMCIAGVFGGAKSGVTTSTKNIFLESAWFEPTSIRKTSVSHVLRTEAATKFEKGVDISNTVNVLKRAAAMIKEIAGGEIASDIIDVYPSPKEKTEVGLKFHYLKKLSGKNYHGETVKNILTSLGFEMIKEGMDELFVKVPFSKPDISIAADLVEEIMRIDGLDNIDIPLLITTAPAIETLAFEAASQEKLSGYLTGIGFNEIFTNSITNSIYFSENTLQTTVKMLNNLSEDLNVLRPSMLQTGLQSIAYNLNRKNNNLHFFEFGKTYAVDGNSNYNEQNHLCLFTTGNNNQNGWKNKSNKTDFYYLKGIIENIATLTGFTKIIFEPQESSDLANAATVKINNKIIAEIGEVNKKTAAIFDCKQAVFFADIYWDDLMELSKNQIIQFKEIPKFPSVQRDLAIVVDKNVTYGQIESTTTGLKINKLKSVNLFDIFESEKLGTNKKSMAINFTFVDDEKTMTDADTESIMNKISKAFVKELGAEIRGN